MKSIKAFFLKRATHNPIRTSNSVDLPSAVKNSDDSCAISSISGISSNPGDSESYEPQTPNTLTASTLSFKPDLVTREASTKSSDVLVKTGVNSVKSLLRALSSISSNVPFSGVGPVCDLLLKTIEGIQETKENIKGFQKFAERLERLSGLALYANQNLAKTSPTESFHKRLETELVDVDFQIKEALRQNRLINFLNSTDDKASLNQHIASLDSIIIDFSASLGVDTNLIVTQMLDILLKLIGQSEKESSTILSSSQLCPPKSSGRHKRLWKEFVQQAWEEIQPEIESGQWMGGTYVASFKKDNSTTYQIEIIDSTSIKWSIHTPTSFWYPGKYSGTLQILADYPFKPPRLRMHTPIFSPIVGQGGHVSVDLLFSHWSAGHTIKDVMDTMAFLLAIDPVCHTDVDDRLPNIPLGFHVMCPSIWDYKQDAGEDAFTRATNFFARTYAQLNVEYIADPPVTQEELRMSVAVIQELLDYFTHQKVLDIAPDGSVSKDPSIAFSSMRTLSEWREEEQRWAKAVSLRCNFHFEGRDDW